MDDFDIEENAFYDICNFIDQEIYVLAVRSSFLEEYESVVKLANDINEALHSIKDEFNDDSKIEEIIEIVVNAVGTGITFESLHDNLIYYIDSEYSLPEDENKDDHIEYIKEVEDLKAKTISCISEVYKFHGGLSFTFKHQYPPYVFCLDNDYLDALQYFYNKEYLPKKREFKGGVEITTIRAPYRILKRYNNSRYSTSIKQFEVNVPEKNLKKSIESGEHENCLPNENENLITELFKLLALNDTDRVAYTNELQISIDTSSPLNNYEVDKILAMIRFELSTIQKRNKHSEYRMAKEIKDIDRAIKIPEISTDNYVVLKKLHTPQIEKLKTVLNAKNYLCGLIILHRYSFEKSDTPPSLEKLRSDLSEKLMFSMNIADSKFSSNTILRGYKQVKKIFKEKIRMLAK